MNAAIEALERCNVPLGADFHTLSSSQVECLLVEANRLKYRKPHNANGSRGRYFHDLLQRRAAYHIQSKCIGLPR
jgi:hypothetical protein